IFEDLKPLLNETSVALEGFEKFNIENYFPRIVDRSYFEKNLAGLADFHAGRSMLEGTALAKERTQHGAPLISADAMEVFDQHINDASMYSQMGVPLRQAAQLIGSSEVRKALADRVG